MVRRLLADRDALIGTVALALVSLVVVLGMTGTVAAILSPSDTRTVRAVFADAQQLRPGDVVRVQGIDSGEVTETELRSDRRTALVTMEVDHDAGPLHADAGAVLRWQTVLGGKFYVDLERGNAARGDLAGVIPVSRTARQVELDDIASVVQGGARSGLQTLPGEMSDALADPKAPAKVLDLVGDIAPDVEKGIGAVRGVDVDRDLRDLVGATADTVRAIDTPQDDLRQVVSGAATTLATTAASGDAIRASLRRTPATLDGVRATTARLDRTLALANPLLDDVREPARDVAPTFRALRPVVADADALVQRAAPLVRALRPAVTSLAGAAKRGLPLVNELAPSLTRVDETILPYLAEKDSGTGKSTAVMIGGTFAALATGAGGQMDANGHFIRFPASTGSSPINSLPCQIYFQNPDAAQVAACASLQEAFGTFLNYQPLGPTPGTTPAPTRRRAGR
jgi:phospholipid/cholesterol/gamma-HCH transport system substrate-binding protein